MPWPLDTLVSTFHNICKHQGGIKIDVVGDRIVISMRSGVHSVTEQDLQRAVLAAGVPLERVPCRVLIEFPGEPPRVPEVSILREGRLDEPYTCEDLLAAMEIVSTEHDRSDLALKEEQYARADVPAFLIVDPLHGHCTLLTRPDSNGYLSRAMYEYGETVPLHLPDGTLVDIPTDTLDRRR